jgi:hypothetical protein
MKDETVNSVNIINMHDSVPQATGGSHKQKTGHCKMEKQKLFIVGRLKERAYLLHHESNHQGLNTFLLEIWMNFLK